MKLSTVLAGLTGLAVSVSSTPVAVAQSLDTSSPEVHVEVYPDGLPKDLIPRAAGSLEKRADTGVYLCTDANFSGYCVHIVQPLYKCVNLAGDLNDLVTSVGPDSAYCLFYRDFNCNDNGDPYAHFGTWPPGYSNLVSINFNDKISSYACSP